MLQIYPICNKNHELRCGEGVDIEVHNRRRSVLNMKKLMFKN